MPTKTASPVELDRRLRRVEGSNLETRLPTVSELDEVTAEVAAIKAEVEGRQS